MAKIEKKTKRYPSDLTDEEWVAISPLLPKAARTGCKRRIDLREVLNAIRYMVRSGCEWRMLPVHFPPWQTVYWWFRRFVRLHLFRTIHDVVLMIDRMRAERSAEPSAEILDSQTVKAPASSGTRGYDGAKKIIGRKRHIAVDTEGRLLIVNLTTDDIADSTGAQAVMEALRKRWPWIKHLFADGAYDRRQMLDKAAFLDFVVEIVRRTDKEFTVLAGLTGEPSMNELLGQWRGVELKSIAREPSVKPQIGKTYAGTFDLGGRNRPLPPGSWTLMASAPHTEHDQTLADEVLLAQITKNSVKGIISLIISRPDVPVAINEPTDICKQSPSYYDKRVRLDLGSQQDCWSFRIAPTSMFRQSRSFEAFEVVVRAQNLPLPEAFLHTGFAMVDRDRLIIINYCFPAAQLAPGLSD